MTPHGHNEFVAVSLQPRETAKGMDWGDANYAASFADLKRHWHAFVDDALDHAFQLGHDDPMIGYFQAHEPELLPRLLVIQGDPTTEAGGDSALPEAERHPRPLPPRFRMHPFRDRGNADQQHRADTRGRGAMLDPPGEWCHRADLSLNDLLPLESWGALT
ncbi:MAG: 6-carboxytetrahydropterin synthase [Asticcacaulis sp.]